MIFKKPCKTLSDEFYLFADGKLINIISGSYIIPGVLIHDHIEFEKKLRELCTEHYDSMTSEELKELD